MLFDSFLTIVLLPTYSTSIFVLVIFDRDRKSLIFKKILPIGIKMHIIRMLSWNVNGLRAINKKGFRVWLEREAPDILCIQETKVMENQVPMELKNIPGCYSYFSSGDKKGYGGGSGFSRA